MWILLNIKQITIRYFWQDITVFHRVFKTCEYFWTFKILQYDIFDRILQYSRVFKMRLNIQKFTIWYCRLDITVFQSIRNMWIRLNTKKLQYDIFDRILQYSRVFKMHFEYFWIYKNLQYDIFDWILTVFQSIPNACEYFWIYKMYNMIFWTGYYSMPEYSKCIWILLNIQNVQYDILNRILQYCRVFKMRLNTFEYTKCTIWYF